jgi:hypothetical protein
MSFPVENNLSTAALEGIAVLNLMNRFIRAGSPKKVATLSSVLEPPSSHVTNRFCALAYIIIVTYIGILPQLINNAYIMKVTCIGILAQLVPPVRPSHLFGRLAIDFGIKRGIK